MRFLFAFLPWLLCLPSMAWSGLDDEALASVVAREARPGSARQSASFRWVDGDAKGGSIEFEGWYSRGPTVIIAEIQAEADFRRAMAVWGIGLTPAFYPGGEVGHYWIPLDVDFLVNAALTSIRMGNSKASFGSFAIERVDARGTTVWMWGRP